MLATDKVIWGSKNPLPVKVSQSERKNALMYTPFKGRETHIANAKHSPSSSGV